ncbi:uncharacterized protein SAPINGB_P001744 [Magnusiomyces paraingens]|uniref:ATP-dependent DNA helicase PIF1 n=1 Tax=Magnusiomyces paraingens TaxID=2606893 RepID=A0A5E8BI10_9ASCO|nr:uncharacterized protein SAPINGB_P001744 [Saprochaete ingens]VVT48369.1 unnamed protein product [Saprochaete ingens]
MKSECQLKSRQNLYENQAEPNLKFLNTGVSSSIPWSESPQYHVKYTAYDLKKISDEYKLNTDLKSEAINGPTFLGDRTSTKNFTKDLVGNNKVPHKTSVWQSRLTGFVSPLTESPVQHERSYSTVARNTSQAKQEKQISSLLTLSDEQKRVLHFIVHEERNVFFTGAAGTGKSILLKRIINELRRKNKSEGAIAVTASTGLAACNIGGITLHSFCGIGLGREPVKNLLKKIRMNRGALKRWKNVKILIIDEISMIDGVLFDKLEELARLIKRNSRPFGGIQVIVTGDFFQLPPVFKTERDYLQKQVIDESEIQGCLAFHSKTWNTVVDTTVELKKIFRQQDDHFSQMLNSIREGHVTNEISLKFRALSRPLLAPHDITPTELFPLRRDVDRSNGAMMRRLPGKTRIFNAVDTYNNEYAREYQILNNLICPEVLSLKVGAQVMLIKNIDETLVNGSLGKLLGFMNEFTFKLVEKLPEGLANSVITGKMTAQEGLETYLDEVKSNEYTDPNLDQTNILQGLSQLIDDDPYDIPVNYEEIDRDNNYAINWTRKKELIEKLNDNTEKKGMEWPFVRFIMSDGTTRDILVQAETWDIENIDGKVEASRSQVPLMLAWALSIHKSQGQTLNWVKVDLSKIFECGQAYVALSRAVKMEGLQVIGFHDSKVRVHQDVVKFYKALPSPLEISLLETAHAKKNRSKKRKLEA